MSKSNKISASFSEINKEAVLVKIAEVKAMMPFLVSLTAEERKTLRKMGPKSVDYVRQSLEGAKAFPDELKKSFDVVEMEKDFTLINNLLGVQIACQSILESINDTMMAGGIDAMEAADEVYASLKSSAKSNVNAKAMVEKISERFKGQGKKANPPTL
jgi:hypothetical protein